MNSEVIEWLLTQDPAVQFQTKRDLLGITGKQLHEARLNMLAKGWVKQLLDLQDTGGTWGHGLYGPKFISTHYTLLLLRRLEAPLTSQIQSGCDRLLEIESIGKTNDPNQDPTRIDACITGMGLSILSFFGKQQQLYQSLLEYIEANQLSDGGWNCRLARFPKEHVHHSSMHTTISVLEGLRDLSIQVPTLKNRIEQLRDPAHEFLLTHELYKSDHTKQIIHPDFIDISFPPRWKYNILSALDYFQSIKSPYDSRMKDALALVAQKGRNGFWSKGKQMTGKVFFKLVSGRKYCAINTLRAHRVINWFIDI